MTVPETAAVSGNARSPFVRYRVWIFVIGIPLAMILLFLLVRAVRPAPVAVYLSDLTPVSARQDWGTLGLDRTVDARPLQIGTIKYPKGLGTHANSKVTYSLDGMYREFVAEVGIDAETAKLNSKVVFRVTGGNRILYQSPVLQGVQQAREVRINILGVKDLVLEVLDGGDGINSDHADWGNARLYR